MGAELELPTHRESSRQLPEAVHRRSFSCSSNNRNALSSDIAKLSRSCRGETRFEVLGEVVNQFEGRPFIPDALRSGDGGEEQFGSKKVSLPLRAYFLGLPAFNIGEGTRPALFCVKQEMADFVRNRESFSSLLANTPIHENSTSSTRRASKQAPSNEPE